MHKKNLTSIFAAIASFIALLFIAVIFRQAFFTTETKTVSIESFAFAPSMVTIPVGSKITWVNDDAAVHRIISSAFKSENLKQGESFSHTFKNIGIYYYSCMFDSNLQGRIVVE